MPELPKRKQVRLKDYDYSQNGYYFITICTHNRENVFWNCRGGQWPPVNENGDIVKNAIENIPKIYKGYNVDKYVIMPNHIHFILVIAHNDGRPMTAPTVSWVVNQFKGFVTKKIGYVIWQKSYYEHIIRNEREYQKIYEYIENNPLKWKEDKYYEAGEIK